MKNKWTDSYKEDKITAEDYKKYVLGELPILQDGEPCSLSGCLNHVFNPCEGCGRIQASTKLTRAYYEN